METTTKKKSFKIGTIRTGNFNGRDSIYISLGDTKNTNPDYVRRVEVIVRDGHNKVVHTQENGLIFLDDPRTFAKDPDKIPAFIRYDLKVSQK